ncbi:Abi family protein [Amedibacillus dolichus]|uniref:Abi family protein n=1 Tax=Amedibacillus dolichus TaxID=31971 RepID=UPI002671B2D6|nr:Abi family protein [Amedibacillus dolichus]
MDKPFKSYNQQMRYLRETKKIDCKGSKHKAILIKHGYFNLINGYKTPFIIGKDANGNHRYIGGTSIDHFKAVKEFDDNIRYILLTYITRCEEEIRTLTGHKFDFVNGNGASEWFEVDSYDPTLSTQDKIKVIAACYNEVNISKQPYVKHYLEEHNSVPTWIFIKVIKFSTFINFIKICKPQVINSICELYQIHDSYGNIKPELLISILHWMRTIRNACAHNERIYGINRENARVKQPFDTFLSNPKPYTNHRSQRLIDIVIYLRYFLNDTDYQKFIYYIKEAFDSLKAQLNQNAFQKVRAETGIKNLDILDELSDISKPILYNNFENL